MSSAKSDISFYHLPLKNEKLLSEYIVKIRRIKTPVNKHIYGSAVNIFSHHVSLNHTMAESKKIERRAVPTKFFFVKQKTACFQFLGKAVSFLGYRGVTCGYKLLDKSTK